MVQLHAPILSNLFGLMDQVSIPFECNYEWVKQNAFYCGYADYDMMVTKNVFA